LKQKNGLKQSEQKMSKAWQDQENDEIYPKSKVEAQHPKVQTRPGATQAPVK